MKKISLIITLGCILGLYQPLNAQDAENVVNGHEYVDLALPSGLKWATCNVGAKTPEASGNYYAWGETKPKYEYTQANSVTYGKEIDDISGNVQYDVAAANWGEGWRMPTKDEFEELIRFCQWDITTENGNLGYSITGPNDNKIFLPVNTFDSGSYWTANPYENDKDTEKYKSAYCMSFDLSPYQHLLEGLCQKEPNIKTFTRDSCNAIRPVSDKTKS